MTKIDELLLIGTYSSRTYQVNRDAMAEYNRLREISNSAPQKAVDGTDYYLNISLLNTKTLKKHAKDIEKYKNVIENGKSYLIETHILIKMIFLVWCNIYTFPAKSFKKYKVKTNPNMCILMYFKIQRDHPRITRKALKSQILDLFTKSSSGQKQNFSLKRHYYTSFIKSRM